MIRLGLYEYDDITEASGCLSELDPATQDLLAKDRRGNARIESLLGFWLLKRMVPSLNLLEVRRTEEGKPYFPNRPDFEFSISHTVGTVACAVSCSGQPREALLGVDAEQKKDYSAREMRRIARWFSPSERERWENNPTSEELLLIWTMKEAVSKLMGSGFRVLRDVDTSDSNPALFRTQFETEKAIVSLVSTENFGTSVPIERYTEKGNR